MDEFLDYIEKRRQRLQAQQLKIEQQLQELVAAEKLYRSSKGANAIRAGGQVSDGLSTGGRTIKERVVELLRLVPEGMTALDILSALQKEIPALTRTSLSPQLSRLKAEETLENDENSGLWRLTASGERSDPLETRRAIDVGNDDPFA